MTSASGQVLVAAPWWRRAQDKSDTGSRWVLVATAFVTPISTAAMNAGFALLLIFFILSGRYRERLVSIKDSPVVWASVFMFLFVCLGALWTIGPLDEAQWQISKYSKLLFIPLVMSLAQSSRTRIAVLTAVLAALLLTMVLSYANAVHPLPAWLSRATREGVLSGNNYIFKHHIIQNVLLSFGALLCLIGAFVREQHWQRAMLLTLGVFCAGSIVFMAQGRTGYLTLAAVFILVVVLVVQRHPRFFWPIVAASILGVAVLAASPALQKRISETVETFHAYQERGEANAIGHRLLFWKTSLDIMKERPLLGAGTGAYRQEFLKRVSDPAFTGYGAYNPHNQYLYFGTQLGVLGMLAFTGMLVIYWFSARNLPWPRRALAHGTVAILAIYCMFDSPLFITEGHFFVILLGVLWAGATWRRAPDLAS